LAYFTRNCLPGAPENRSNSLCCILIFWWTTSHVRAVFSGHDRHAVLANCERGEDAAQSAYKEALSENDLPAYVRTMLEEQKQNLRASHDKIKALRDAAK
jgi:uncharacterized protein (TIGR02284 family)